MKKVLVFAVMFLYQVAAARLLKDPAYMFGADRDEYGCIQSAGYSWCEFTQSCQSSNQICIPSLFGSHRDEYGCIQSAGYSWCEFSQSCQPSNELCSHDI